MCCVCVCVCLWLGRQHDERVIRISRRVTATSPPSSPSCSDRFLPLHRHHRRTYLSTLLSFPRFLTFSPSFFISLPPHSWAVFFVVIDLAA
ncbi:hypothetical protein LX32DRAFT_316086 [Colletotrichum zoysiae]|uniref:Uncharacterized protein n=1 Tax=Colletotrichum zoysiae TaxID=1216348 RepID=A0AAD9LW41_9PEZI|nr:hypothetical protein LX32DRAFT_316086 [Colletotrichum zoysiae]